jgi:membrane fusion protein
MQARQTENLFRQSAINALASRLDGRPIALMPKPWVWLALFCASFVVIAGSFLWHAEYARKETVRGWLVVEPGVVRLAHSDFATVATIDRVAGAPVRRGDLIVRLTSKVTLGDGTDAVLLALENLDEQLTGVHDRAGLAREQFAADHRALEAQLLRLDQEIDALDSQQREQGGRVQRNASRLRDLELALKRGAIAKIDVVRQRDELATMQQSVARLRQERNSLGRTRNELLAAQERLGIELERRLALLGTERGEVQQRIALHEQQRSLSVRSPVNGTLATVDVAAGSAIRPQQLLATIIPDNSLLAADVYVPSRAVGMVRPGQTVRLLYDAFPHQQFGTARGKVAAVAGFVSLPGDMPAAAAVREAAYKVRIHVADDYVEDAQGRYALRPGMALAAEIVLENRSLADWFLAPIRARL